MKNLFEILSKKPPLFEQSEMNIWQNPHLSKGMLEAHLNETTEAATRRISFIQTSVHWIHSLLPPNQYPTLLDLGCGPGIYSELFYQAGYQVTGFDFSARSIEHAKKSASDKKMSINYLLKDYAQDSINGKYNIVTMIYCDYGVLPSDLRKRLLKKIYNCLLPNGVFLFDVFTPLKYKGISESHQWSIQENGFWHEGTSLVFHSFYRYEEDQTFLNQHTIYTSEKEIMNYHVWEHTFTKEELQNELEMAGFKRIRYYGNVAGEEECDNHDTLCLVAMK